MQISNNYLTNLVYKSYQQNQTGHADETPFADMVRSAKGYTGQGSFAQKSPEAQVWEDYLDWKSTQPPRDLPDSQGDTEENRAYLRERFSGELTLFQKLDAADTMVDMGMISREEMLNAIGLGPNSLWIVGDCKIICNGTVENAPYMAPWSRFFTDAPINQTNTLEGIFKLITDHLRRIQEREKEDAAAEEIRKTLDHITHRVPA